MKYIQKLLSALTVFIFLLHVLSIASIAFDTIYYKLLFLVLEIVFLSSYAVIYSKDKERHHKKRSIIQMHYMVCFLYVVSLIDVLFLSSDLQRGATYVADFTHMNTVPLATIKLYYNGYVTGAISFESFFMNIIGNVILFMPLAYFLPFFFKSQRKWYSFLTTIVFITLIVELLQINLSVGSADIDDIILNVTGAFIFYGLMQLTFNKFIYRILGRE